MASAGAGGAPGDAGPGGAAGTEDPGAGERRPYRAIDVAVGRRHSCALLDDPAFTVPGQLGGVEIKLGEPATKIGAGDKHLCALLQSGAVKCWHWEEPPSPLAGASEPQVTGWNAVDLGTVQP